MEDAREGCQTPDFSLEHALADLVSRKTVRVPPYPATALRLSGVLSKDDYSTQDLVEAMRGDPVFTGNLLRLANSSFYRRGGEVTSLPVAVQRLGARELTRLAMASTVAKLSLGEGPLEPLRRRAWREALAGAVVCETLCRLETGDGGEGFVAALLHDTGKLLVLGAIDEVCRYAPALASRDEATWVSLVDRFHVPFGELLAQRWNLPGVLGAVITTHHDAPSSLGPLTRAVVMADTVVALLERRVEVRASDLEALGLDQRASDAVARVIPTIPATLRAFDPTASTSTPVPSPRPAASAGPKNGALTVQVDAEPSWPVHHFDEHALEVTVPRALAPHLLLELTLMPAGLHFFALVERCEARDGQWAARLTPFAMPPEEALRWQTLSAQRAA